MKAHEVLKRYADGRRDFSGENLRGQSFKGKNLSGVDFSEADIRGANFTNATLTGANFKGARAGLQRRWATGLVVASWILSALSGIFSAYTGYLVALIFNSSSTEVLAGWVALIVLVVFFIVTLRQGLLEGLGAVAGIFAGVFAGVGAVAGAIAGVFAGAVAVAVAVGGAVTGAVAGVFVGAVAGVLAAAITVAVTVAAAFSLFNAYIGWRALAGDKKYVLVRSVAITFAATGGTSFRNADLTDADFTSATLKSTDFRGVILTRTRWHKVKMLDRGRVDNSILADASVRELLINGEGKNKSYVGADLYGANLAEAYLNSSNLQEAKLDHATFQHANLEGANLTQASSIGTDFSHAHLTGACIESWNIDITTKLEQVDCRFIYLLEKPNPITGDRERRPHDPDKVFEPGDFEKLYNKIINTVQILLRNGINQEAFNLAFQKIMEENPEITVDSIQGMEKKGNDVLVTLEVPEDTDKGKFEQQFFEVYELRLATQNQAKLLEAETRHSQDIKEIAIAAFMNNPSINLTNEVKTENKAMSDSTDQSRKIENRDGSVTGNILGDSNTISGTVTNTINQLPASSEPNKPGLKELLVQLQAAINDPNLAEDDKTQALEQIKVLAEAGQNPKNETTQKQAKKALGFLKVIAEGLPSAASLVKTCQDILPAIALYFGL